MEVRMRKRKRKKKKQTPYGGKLDSALLAATP